LSDDAWSTIHHNLAHWILSLQTQAEMDIADEKAIIIKTAVNLNAAAEYLKEELSNQPQIVRQAENVQIQVKAGLDVALAMLTCESVILFV
jgi:hypothetical protein